MNEKELYELITFNQEVAEEVVEALEERHRNDGKVRFVYSLQGSFLDEESMWELAREGAGTSEGELHPGMKEIIGEFFEEFGKRVGEDISPAPSEAEESEGAGESGAGGVPTAGESESDGPVSDESGQGEGIQERETPDSEVEEAEPTIEEPPHEGEESGESPQHEEEEGGEGEHGGGEDLTPGQGRGHAGSEVDHLEKIRTLESENKTLGERNRELEQKLKSKEDEVFHLVAERDRARHDLEELKGRTEAYTSTMSSLREEVRLCVSEKNRQKIKNMVEVLKVMRDRGGGARVKEIQEVLGWKRARVIRTMAVKDRDTPDLKKLKLVKKVQRGTYIMTEEAKNAGTDGELAKLAAAGLADFRIESSFREHQG